MSLSFSKFKSPVGQTRKWSRALLVPALVIGSFLLAQVIVVAVAQLLKLMHVSLAGVDETILNTLVSIVVYGITLALVIIVPRQLKKIRTTPDELGIQRWPTWTDMLLAPPGFIVYIVLSALLTTVAMWLPWYDASQVQDTGFGHFVARYEYILAFFSLVLLAPLAEEVLFRGYLFGKLKKHVPIWASVLITSLVFAALHGSWNVGVDVFALSIILCLLRLTTGSIWTGVLIHMIKNGIAFYILFISPILSHTMGG
jgi:uncharacterized protein